jgi:type IV pilus assembly protein PilW
MNNSPFPSHRLQRRTERGFSLVELMVAITIGLFITLGLSQIFLSMYSTSQSQNTLSAFQDNQRLAVVMVVNTVQAAGYYPSPSSQTAASALSYVGPNTFSYSTPVADTGDNSTFVAGVGITGAGDGGVTTADSIDIAYETSGSDNIYNCQGGTASAATIFVNSISVNSSNQLVCVVNSIAGVSKPVPSTNALVLATGVTSMTILYGVDVAGLGTTGSYLTAKAVQAAGLWTSVRTVQITLNFTPPTLISGAKAPTPVAWTQTINLMRVS